MKLYSDREQDFAARSEPIERQSTLLWGLGLGALAGASAYALYAARRDRDGLSYRPADSAPGRSAKQSRFGEYAVVGRTVTIDRPRDDLYRYWRNFKNLSGFMENVKSVEPIEEAKGRFRWMIEGPAGTDVRIETEVVSDKPGEEIAWRSLQTSQIDTKGKVSFRDAPGNRGTEVEALIAYDPPGGELGRWIAKLFQAEPALQGRRDLKRFKMLVETGEIATSANRKSDK
ncbi:SRPBCC family protein [Sulfitobacter delicatus]|uniref:Uncharacterized membrane protein n=1 Tax=Sulfitobacter delicatus TaxID=218672 RepID=A0A1G7Y8G7_9RHOB|nr:SRPBCC family protein [Sulfitobacter delicatus]SDG92761.1 Uncharacterized membrane protein [Sulfitobacter delicatus]